jgi:hypothetical protein
VAYGIEQQQLWYQRTNCLELWLPAWVGAVSFRHTSNCTAADVALNCLVTLAVSCAYVKAESMLLEYTQLGGEFEQIVHEFGDTMVSTVAVTATAAQAGQLTCGSLIPARRSVRPLPSNISDYNVHGAADVIV